MKSSVSVVCDWDKKGEDIRYCQDCLPVDFSVAFPRNGCCEHNEQSKVAALIESPRCLCLKNSLCVRTPSAVAPANSCLPPPILTAWKKPAQHIPHSSHLSRWPILAKSCLHSAGRPWDLHSFRNSNKLRKPGIRVKAEDASLKKD